MRLQAIRDAKGLTQTDLEDLSGVPQPTIALIERSVQPNPKWDTVCRLSYALGERPETIFGIPLQFTGRRRMSRQVLRALKNQTRRTGARGRRTR